VDPVPLLDLRAQLSSIREEVYRAVHGVIESQKFILGEQVERFEEEIARFTGVPHAVGCASGTDSLILSLAALDVGPGDRVLTTPFSFFATASSAYRVGARPVFVDIDPESFNMDPEKVEAALTDRTRALFPVHMFGQCVDMDPVLEIAERRNLPVVEDAAQALGASYDSNRAGVRLRAGAMGSLGCYSFFPSKNLGGYGDGGMVVARDAAMAQKIRALRVHGELRGYEHESVGWNSRLDALQAAVLLVKLPHLDGWSRSRAANADRYDRWLSEAGLVESGRVRLPSRTARCDHIFNQYTLRVEDRDELRGHLEKRGIGHAVYYPAPLHLQPCFAELGHSVGDFPQAESAARKVISLPVYPELRADQQERVVQAVAEFYGKG